MKKDRYPAQALAIAMVVLVVASIIGISVYSRISKDKTESLDERSSAEALQVSDLLLNYLTAYPVTTVIKDAGAFISDPTVTLSEKDGHQITNLLQTLGALKSTESLSTLDICPLSDTNTNDYYLNISKADIDTYYEIMAGQTFALPINNETLGTNCDQTTLKIAQRGDSNVGFSITYIYASNYGADGMPQQYKPYETADTVNYCFSNGTACNNSINFVDGGWTLYTPDTNLTINIKTSKSGYQLDEIRIMAINGAIGIAYQIPSSCTQALNLINVQAGANCEGTYRGKSILIPEKQWENQLFNYSVFNGVGTL